MDGDGWRETHARSSGREMSAWDVDKSVYKMSLKTRKPSCMGVLMEVTGASVRIGMGKSDNI